MTRCIHSIAKAFCIEKNFTGKESILMFLNNNCDKLNSGKDYCNYNILRRRVRMKDAKVATWFLALILLSTLIVPVHRSQSKWDAHENSARLISSQKSTLRPAEDHSAWLPLILKTSAMRFPIGAVFYGNFRHPDSYISLEEAARYDLIVTSRSASYAGWRSGPSQKDAFLRLKALNPKLKIMVYQMGPGQYIESDWGKVGDGLDWVKANHGKNASDRWLSLGVSTGEYLRALPYPVERAMHLGNRNWQDYWNARTVQDFFTAGQPNYLAGADGIFADGMQPSVHWSNKWCPESKLFFPQGSTIPYCGDTQNSAVDHPDFYYQGGTYNTARWYSDLVSFLDRAVPYWRERNLLFGLNAWIVVETSTQPYRRDLNRIQPFLVMDEYSFYGDSSGNAPTVTQWERALANLRDAQGYRLFSMNRFITSCSQQGLDRLDCKNRAGASGWDVLWFSLMSFLLGYNFDLENPNGYFAFSAWGYQDQYVYPEYDRLPDIGAPLSEARKEANGLWLRPFERGLIAVNITDQEIQYHLARQARVLGHTNFLDPSSVPATSQLVLPAGRGALLIYTE